MHVESKNMVKLSINVCFNKYHTNTRIIIYPGGGGRGGGVAVYRKPPLKRGTLPNL